MMQQLSLLRRHSALVLTFVVAIGVSTAGQNRGRGPGDLANAAVPPGAIRIAYGSAPLQSTTIATAGHFVFIDPESDVWPHVVAAVRKATAGTTGPAAAAPPF